MRLLYDFSVQVEVEADSRDEGDNLAMERMMEEMSKTNLTDWQMEDWSPSEWVEENGEGWWVS